MTSSFPIVLENEHFVGEDFHRFARFFEKIIWECVPTVKEVRFVVGNGASYLQESYLEHEEDIFFLEDDLLFRFELAGGDLALVCAKNIDHYVIQRSCHDWLGELYSSVKKRFFQVRNVWLDPQSGALSYQALQCCDIQSEVAGILLVDIPPRRLGSRHSFNSIQSSYQKLQSLLPGAGFLYYLGHSLFALLLHKPIALGGAATALLSRLRHDGVARVHIGISFVGTNRFELLDTAWQALGEAEKRGAYSFCDYKVLASPEDHLLPHIPLPLIRRMRAAVRTCDLFSVVLFQTSSEAEQQCLEIFLQDQYHFQQTSCFVLRPGENAASARNWAERIIEQMLDLGISVGVAESESTGSRAQPFDHAIKALVHSSFYGDRTVTIFNAVSLNISGDIYYNEGNFTRAIREYREALQYDANDVNIHNSLAVAYMMVGKNALGCEHFIRVLEIESKNFMALYNLGLYYQSCKNSVLAQEYFEGALAVGTEDNLQELRLQYYLGVLYSREGLAEKAIHLLELCRKNPNNIHQKELLFYLGKAYYDSGDKRLAVRWLQRAVTARVDEGESLSLLGYLYFLLGESGDVALSLCRRSVGKNPRKWIFRLRFSEVLFACGYENEALLQVRRCLQTPERKAARRLLASFYEQRGEFAKQRRLV